MAEVKLKEETELWDPPNTKHSVEPRHIKEEPEEEQLPFSPASVKTEEDDEEECDTVSIKAVNIGVQIVSVKSEEEVGPSLEPPHIKEEPEEELLQEFPFTLVSVKTEDDGDKSSVLHQRPTEENREETNGEECGAEAGCSSDPHLHSDSEGHRRKHSDDWSPDQSPSKRSSAMINPDSSERDAGENDKLYQCSECEKRFLRQHNLQNHMMSHTGEKPFTCPFCEREFTRICNLKSHMSIHTGQWPFRCSFCDKGCWNKRDFLVHMRVHTGEKPFSCSVCNKGFSHRSNLRQHTLTHTGEKPFSCSVCQKCFGDRCTLNRHMKTHTGEKPYSCSVCEKRFTQNTHLRVHMKTHSRAGALSPEGGERSEPKSDSDVHMRDQSEPTPTDLDF